MKQLFVSLLVLLCWTATAQVDRSEVQSVPPKVSQGQLLGTIPALRERAPDTQYKIGAPGSLYEKKNYFSNNLQHNPHALPNQGDPLVKNQANFGQDNGPQVIPGLNFEGLRDNSGIYPPDPNGDVGKDHYMQMVNTAGGAWFQIWDKYTGNSVYGPALSSTFWGSFGLPTLGDPIVLYDHDAERWLVMEIQANSSNPFVSKQLFLAVSDNSDPTGGWKAYLFQTLGFPDYPKLYIWNNSYFITVNELLNGNKCAGYALDRSAILNNEPSFNIYRFELPNYQSIIFQPATGVSWDAGPTPPAGSPGYIFRVYDDAWEGGDDQLQYWEIFVDWANPNQSHADGPVKINTAPFETRVCFGGNFTDCIEQPGGNSPLLMAFENTIMFSAPYRNFGDHESIVLNHVCDVSGQTGDGGDAQVRWYELRKSGAGDWQIYQQGTHAPDLQTNRITGTINIDEAGNIGLGYSGLSETLFPGLYLTGHRNGDPLGQMTLDEYTLVNGGASHFSSRWGDYSSMSVDPYDGRTFWFTGEYQPNNLVSWGTRIGSFKVQRDTFDIKPELISAPQPSAYLGSSEQVAVKIVNTGLLPAGDFSISLYFEDAFVATEPVNGILQPGESITHTFAPTVAMTVPGKLYRFKFITHWTLDRFVRNDTLEVTVERLTANDASLAGKFNLPGLVCGTETDFALILKNASGGPMTSARVHWRINTQAWNTFDWTGNLSPGERDTLEFSATGIVNGLNGLRAYTTIPNGIQDEKISNDTLIVKFFGNTDGSYLSVESETTLGELHWELRTLTNQLLAMGDVSAQQPDARICADDNQCYRIVLRASNFNWNGHFVLKNIFGAVLVEIDEAVSAEQVFTICTPIRQQVDVGPLTLVAPQSGPNLGASELVQVAFRNFGLSGQSNINLAYRVNGGVWVNETVAGPLGPSQTLVHTFQTPADLSVAGAQYELEVLATVTGDQSTNNDTLKTPIFNRYLRDLEIVEIDPGNTCSDTAFTFVNLRLKNNGIGMQHVLKAEITLNGVVLPLVENLVLDAASDQIGEIVLYLEHLNAGLNTLQVRIVDVDGEGPDELAANDLGSLSFVADPSYTLLGMVFTPNQAPQETSWKILDAAGTVVSTGGAYADPFGFYYETICLPKDSCYRLVLTDSGGNGNTGGYLSITVDNIAVLEYSGTDFGSTIELPFCAVSACADFALEASVSPSSGAGVNDGEILVEAIGGTPPYFYELNGIISQDSAVFKNLLPGAYTILCIDALGCAESIVVNLGTVSSSEASFHARLLISPNPTIGVAHIALDVPGTAPSALCEVFNQEGKRIQFTRMSRWDQTLHGNIALDRFPTGVYFVRIVVEGRNYVGRVIKQR